MDKRHIAVLAAWLMLVVFVGRFALLAFKVLVYNDADVLPKWTEASRALEILDTYTPNAASSNLTLIIVKVNSTDELNGVLSQVNGILSSINVSYIDLETIYNEALAKYNSTIADEANKLYLNYSRYVIGAYVNETSMCSSLLKASLGYYSTLSNYTNAVEQFYNWTGRYLEALYSYISLNPYVKLSSAIYYAYREVNGDDPYSLAFVNTLNETLGQYVASYVNVTMYNYAVSKAMRSAISSINETYTPILEKYLNESPLAPAVIALGPNPPLSLVSKIVASYYINDTPPFIEPYLPQLACGSNSTLSEVLSNLNRTILKIITSKYPPPTIAGLAKDFEGRLYNNGYALILANASSMGRLQEALSNVSYAYPFSVSLVLNDLEKIVESDVPIIDEVSGVLVMSMLLFVLGTLAAPIVILGLLVSVYGLSLSAVYFMGKLGLTVYYLTVYMISPIVFGIGVDYSLLMIGRYIEERGRGLGKDEAIAVVKQRVIPTIATSGSVVASGLGSFVISNYQYIQVIGLSYIFTVIFILAALSIVMPSIMAIMGDGILWPSGLGKSTRELRTGVLVKLAKWSMRRPWLVILASIAATAISIMYIVKVPQSSNPMDLMPPIKPIVAYNLISANFHNSIYSTQYIIIKPYNAGAFNEFLKLANATGVVEGSQVLYNSTGLTIVKLTTRYNPLSDKLIMLYVNLSKIAVDVSRDYGVSILIGGDASDKYFFIRVFEDQFWGLIAYLIVALNILILSIMLRSVVVPLRLVATVMMSMSWALAIGELVFYGIMHIPTYWLLPIILYALLMSVGTDYDIFIVSRVREEVLKGLSDEEAILRAIESTGPIVTGAAMVLAAAFASLGVSNLYILREIGFTVALSVVLDAFIMRPAVVPAIMMLAGRYNWWPSGLSQGRLKTATSLPKPGM